uniref:Uncharacterized protein n=1 Tax=viral metagenome TaxID=1070528 RepID=A0A6M3Y4U1_9ZZZZ
MTAAERAEFLEEIERRISEAESRVRRARLELARLETARRVVVDGEAEAGVVRNWLKGK